MDIISQLPYAGIITTVVVIVLAIAASVYMLDGDRRKRRVEENGTEDRLINLLKEEVGELTKKVGKLERREEELTREVSELRKDNERYLKILQGRDEDTQEFHRKAFETMKLSAETHQIVVKMAEGMQASNDNMKQLIGLLSKHADVLDHSISKNKQN